MMENFKGLLVICAVILCCTVMPLMIEIVDSALRGEIRHTEPMRAWDSGEEYGEFRMEELRRIR
jgi:hypothetical protein